MRAPAALAAIPFLCGSAFSLLYWQQLPTAAPLLAASAALIALLAAVAAATDEDPKMSCAAGLTGSLLAGVSLGSVAADRAYNPPLVQWYARHGNSEPVVVEGRLREDAAITPSGVSMTIDVERVAVLPVFGGARLSIAGSLSARSAGEWRRGRRVRCPAILRRPSVYRNPGVPDETKALARRGICLVGSVKSAALVERLADGTPIEEAASTARAWARQRLASAIGPLHERSAAITTAILIGDRSRLPDDDERRLQKAGTYHVIAISGGNIAVVTALLMLLWRALCLPARHASALTIAALLFYGQVTGPAASVERAVAVAVIFLAARLADHRGPAINAVAVAGVLSAATAPVAVLDAGFILSFGATLGILLVAPILIDPRGRSRAGLLTRSLRSIGYGVRAVLAATICAELALAPVSASLFGRITFAGLLLNFAAIPLMTVVQLAGGAVLGLSELAPGVCEWAALTAHVAVTGLVESARLVDAAPWLAVAVHPPSWVLMTLYYAAVIAIVSATRPRWPATALAVTLGLMLFGPAAMARGTVLPSRHPLRIVVLDVGQGDATLVLLPDNHALLVDAGGAGISSALVTDGSTPGFDVGEQVVVPALRALAAPPLDAFVVTHADPDHILGAPAVFGVHPIRSVWEGVAVASHPGLQALRHLAGRRGATWRVVRAGDAEHFGDVEVRVLHPPAPEWERQRVRNEDSIVLELRLGHVSVVLAGDVGREGERAILPRLEPGRLTVLKAGHHGSNTSSTPELLAALSPAAVVFSAGRDNRFGHPHPAVVNRFEENGSAIFRTDRDGAVFVETDGKMVEIRGWTGRALTVGALNVPDGQTTKTAKEGRP